MFTYGEFIGEISSNRIFYHVRWYSKQIIDHSCIREFSSFSPRINTPVIRSQQSSIFHSMEKQDFSRNRHRLLLLIVLSLLFLTSFYLTKWSLALAGIKTWTGFRLIAMPCPTSKECVDFNVSYSSNGQVIFYGNKNTAYIGKKIFRLSKDRRMAIRKLINEYSFSLDLERKNLLIEMEFSHKQTKVFWWDHQNIAYQKLLSLLTIENLSAYKRWSTLWQMAHQRAAIRSREQKFKRSIDSQWLIVPTASNVYMGWEMSYDVIPPVVQWIRTDGILLEYVDDNVCFSLQEGLTDFDLVDACLATNDIIAENQFYPLRDEGTGIFNTNERMDATSKCEIKLNHWILIHRGFFCLLRL